MAVTWTKELYDQAYEFDAEPEGHPNTRPGIRLHYNRYVMYPEMLRRAQALVEILGITPADRVLIIGCGFGWTAEAMAGLGYNVVGTDVSPYIQSNKDLSEDAEISSAISATGLSPTSGEGLVHFNRLKGDGTRTRAKVLNEDSLTTRSRNAVKRELGDPTVVITEDLVTSLSDSECATLQNEIVKYANGIKVCHFVTEFANPNAPFFFNSKSLAGWKAVFPTSVIVADGYTYRVA